MRGRLQNAEAQGKERLLGMPTIGRPFDPDQEEPVENLILRGQILLEAVA